MQMNEMMKMRREDGDGDGVKAPSGSVILSQINSTSLIDIGLLVQLFANCRERPGDLSNRHIPI